MVVTSTNMDEEDDNNNNNNNNNDQLINKERELKILHERLSLLENSGSYQVEYKRNEKPPRSSSWGGVDYNNHVTKQNGGSGVSRVKSPGGGGGGSGGGGGGGGGGGYNVSITDHKQSNGSLGGGSKTSVTFGGVSGSKTQNERGTVAVSSQQDNSVKVNQSSTTITSQGSKGSNNNNNNTSVKYVDEKPVRYIEDLPLRSTNQSVNGVSRGSSGGGGSVGGGGGPISSSNTGGSARLSGRGRGGNNNTNTSGGSAGSNFGGVGEGLKDIWEVW